MAPLHAKIMADLAKQIQSSLAELTDGTVAHRSLRPFLVQLREVWEPPPAMAPSIEESGDILRAPMFMPAPSRVPAEPARRPPPWYIGMSSAFVRAIMGIDRKLQGRILEAVANIVENPLELQGDTVKPLTGELKGCWRYRIGDFRLIYSADRKSGNVTLLTFTPRGSAYED